MHRSCADDSDSAAVDPPHAARPSVTRPASTATPRRFWEVVMVMLLIVRDVRAGRFRSPRRVSRRRRRRARSGLGGDVEAGPEPADGVEVGEGHAPGVGVDEPVARVQVPDPAEEDLRGSSVRIRSCTVHSNATGASAIRGGRDPARRRRSSGRRPPARLTSAGYASPQRVHPRRPWPRRACARRTRPCESMLRRGVLLGAVLEAVDADHQQRWVLADHAEHAERRGVDDAVGARRWSRARSAGARSGSPSACTAGTTPRSSKSIVSHATPPTS